VQFFVLMMIEMYSWTQLTTEIAYKKNNNKTQRRRKRE